MIRNLLILLYILSVVQATFDVKLGLFLGLSAKNLLLYALIFAIFSRAVLTNTRIEIPLLGIHVAFGLLVFYAALSWMLNSLFDPTYPAFKGFVSLKNGMVDNFLFFLVFFFGPNNYEDAKKIFLFALHMIAAMSVLTILDMSPIIDLGLMEQDSDGRVRGPIGESNQYGTFMDFFVPLFAAMALGSKGFARVVWWLVFFCGFGLLIATGSRGALAGILLGAMIGLKFVMPYFDRRRIKFTAAKMIVVLLLISVGVAVTNYELVSKRIEQSTSTDLDRMSSGRSAIWKATILVQAEEPISFLVGQGWNSHENSGIWKSAHNHYLLIFYELGLIGLALFVIFLASIVLFIRTLVERTEGKERVLMAGIAFGLFSVLVSIAFVDLVTPWFYIWSFMAMSLRIAYEKDREFQLQGSPSRETSFA